MGTHSGDDERVSYKVIIPGNTCMHIEPGVMLMFIEEERDPQA